MINLLGGLKLDKHRIIESKFREHHRSVVRVFGVTIGLAVAYYAWAINAPTFANTQLGMLSDRIGRKPVMLISAASAMVLYYPITWWLQNDFLVLVLSVSIMSALLAGALAIMPA